MDEGEGGSWFRVKVRVKVKVKVRVRVRVRVLRLFPQCWVRPRPNVIIRQRFR